MPEYYTHSVEGKPKSEWQGRQLFELFKQLERFLTVHCPCLLRLEIGNIEGKFCEFKEKRIAVKVIDHRWNEVMVVREMK